MHSSDSPMHHDLHNVPLPPPAAAWRDDRLENWDAGAYLLRVVRLRGEMGCGYEHVIPCDKVFNLSLGFENSFLISLRVSSLCLSRVIIFPASTHFLI
jgi:hypothetical protein